MTTTALRHLFRRAVIRLNKKPMESLERRKRLGNIFESSWVEKGETERRAKKNKRNRA